MSIGFEFEIEFEIEIAKLPDVMNEIVKLDTEVRLKVRLKYEFTFLQSHSDLRWKESSFTVIANDWIHNIGHQSRIELDRMVLAL
jgi:hypothetical protein